MHVIFHMPNGPVSNAGLQGEVSDFFPNQATKPLPSAFANSTAVEMQG
jgi:hypothetical protein